jgi:hypothetical protein
MKYSNLKSAFILLAKFCQKIEMKKWKKSGNELILDGEVSIAKRGKEILQIVKLLYSVPISSPKN